MVETQNCAFLPYACTLTVFTSTGVAIHTQKVTVADETVYPERLPTGMYLFRLEKTAKRKRLKQ
jgi:hypothetical protein